MEIIDKPRYNLGIAYAYHKYEILRDKYKKLKYQSFRSFFNYTQTYHMKWGELNSYWIIMSMPR
jgi:hypothetical protein